MREIEALFAREEEFGDLDAAGAVERLSRAIQYPTINWADHSRTDFAPFEGLLAHIRASYPTLMERGKLERIGHGVLITIPGRDPALRPCLYMSHQDVVPVVEGTEGDWSHPPFSGAVADGYIWGRGALDIKKQVFGLLEAAEYLLRRGAAFARTAYLAFGDDEETLNLGARAIARELERRGVTLEFVLDEGSGKVEPGDALGAPGVLISPIGLMGHPAVGAKQVAGESVLLLFASRRTSEQGRRFLVMTELDGFLLRQRDVVFNARNALKRNSLHAVLAIKMNRYGSLQQGG